MTKQNALKSTRKNTRQARKLSKHLKVKSKYIRNKKSKKKKDIHQNGVKNEKFLIKNCSNINSAGRITK